MEDVREATKRPFPREISSGSGTDTAFSVEARVSFNFPPAPIGDQIFDGEWRAIDFKRSPIGVPSGYDFSGKRDQHGLYSYAAAQSLRWWFAAECELSMRAHSVQTRLVKHTILNSYKIIAEVAMEEVGDSILRAIDQARAALAACEPQP